MIVNENIKYIRELAELTQAQFSNIFRVPLSSWKNYENTDVMPKVDLLNNMSRVLKISVDDLINKKLAASDIHIERLKMEQIVVGPEKDRGDFWYGVADKKAYSLEELQEKYDELTTAYIDSLKKVNESTITARDMVSDVNEQRNADMKMLVSMIGEISKRLDRLEEQFDESRTNLQKQIEELEKGMATSFRSLDKIEGDIYRLKNT